MPDNLFTLYPNPNELLDLQPEDLAGAILEVTPSATQHGIFNYDGLLAPLFPAVGTGYPRGLQVDVRNRIAEALAWLMNQGLVIREPGQPAEWYRVTRKGEPLKTRAEVVAFRRGSRPNVGLGFASPDPPLRRVVPRDVPGGGTEVFPPITPAGRPGREPTRAAETSFPQFVQTYLVTTPLRLPPNVIDAATLFSLTLRFDEQLHNQLHVADVLAEDIEGWERVPVKSGEELLDRLATVGGEVSPPLREAIIEALNERAAVLKFSNPSPFTVSDLENLPTALTAFSHLSTHDLVVGTLSMVGCMIILAIGVGLSVLAYNAVVEVGNAKITKAVERLHRQQ